MEGYRRAMLGWPPSSRLLGLSVLLSLLAGIHNDCGPPPKLNNAVPLMETHKESFLPFQSVTYKCLDGFYNIHGKLDVATCLSDSEWSPIEEFCEPRCVKPPKHTFAKIHPKDIKTYYLAETNVSYICRPGYDNIPGISSVITCLENYTWSALPVFCKGKACGDPGKPENGDTVILTDLLYLAKINFTCKKGYRLIGSPSTQCLLKGSRVEWETKPPECQSIPMLTTPLTGTIRQVELDGGSTEVTTTTLISPVQKQGPHLWTTIGICIISIVVVLGAAAAVTLGQKKKRSYHMKQETSYIMKARSN